MTYNPDIPQNVPVPRDAVTLLQTNFSQYATVFDNNHTALNNTNQGKHEAVIFQEQVTEPDITNNFDALYSALVNIPSLASEQLFLKIPQFLPNGKPNTPEQLTYHTVSNVGPNYQTFLPGGYTMYFGTVNFVPQTISLSPNPTQILSVVANSNDPPTGGTPIANDVAVVILNNFQFLINSASATMPYQFSWIAICKQ